MATRGLCQEALPTLRHHGAMTADIDLIVPLKSPHQAKTRLRAPSAPSAQHAELVTALARDTLAAARATPQVRSLLVVTTAPQALATLTTHDTELLDEADAGGLNAAVARGEQLLRGRRHTSGVVGVLQADLPALRSQELTAAVLEAAGERSFVADRHGTGTTLLLAAPDEPLCPLFGDGSAAAHADSGARALTTAVPTLRSDVDTAADLVHTRELGLGRHTREVLSGFVTTPSC